MRRERSAASGYEFLGVVDGFKERPFERVGSAVNDELDVVVESEEANSVVARLDAWCQEAHQRMIR